MDARDSNSDWVVWKGAAVMAGEKEDHKTQGFVKGEELCFRHCDYNFS